MISQRISNLTARARGPGAALCCAAFLALFTGVSASAAELGPEAQLGKSIFFDQNLSINQNQSCAACHAPEVGWTGPDEAINAHGAVYEGSIPGRFGDRKPPSSGYATQSPILHLLLSNKDALFVGGNFWDGRATGEKLGNPAADQAQGPFLNPAEQALPDSACVVYRVCNPVNPDDYPVSFEDIWGAGTCDIAWPANVEIKCAKEGGSVALSTQDRIVSDANYDRIALSIAVYEGSPEVNAFTSQYDYAMRGMARLTPAQRRGAALFRGKGKCSNCHLISGRMPLFTDFTYDNLGIPKNPENPMYQVDPDFVDLGLGGFLANRPEYAEYAEENRGKHKVPTLRNVDKRPSPDFVKAYGHNGYFKSLKEIVHFYNTRDVLPECPPDDLEGAGESCWPAPEVPENINTSELGNLGLTSVEEDLIVVFLKALTDGYQP
ncbi:MAG: cytochrome C [Myxococcales bacterium]|nr:cytochrome C [Myxococcales bacterium]MDH5307746.1 cytochrome C [Myxococcales bacterium]MDH5567820.1 cytochrome C [Myxococcales bacterium]